MLAFRIGITLSLLAFAAAPALEHPGPVPTFSRAARNQLQTPTVTALTVAGGVSLGVYQAGFLYYYTRFLQEYAVWSDENPDPGVRPPNAGSPTLEVVTGASAGSINAFLAAVTMCSKRIDKPEDSPFWAIWEDVGVKELRADAETRGSLLSNKRRIAVSKILQKLWGDKYRWSDHGCSIHVGISATRLTGRSLDVGPLRSNKRLTEKFVFTLQKKGAEAPDFQTSKKLRPQSVDERFYPTLGWGNRPSLDDVTNLLLASSAFPLAFPPQPLQYQFFTDEQEDCCTDEAAVVSSGSRQTGLFVDGGVLDNQPVKLARTLLRWRACKEDPSHCGDANDRIAHQVYVDTSAVEYEKSAEMEQPIVDMSPVAQYGRFLREYVSAAGQSEFLDAAEDKDFANRLSVPRRTLPIAGEHLLHFGAFADKVFRRNDFYVGMVDAYQFLRKSEQFRVFFDPSAGDEADPVPITSLEYRCYRHRMVTGRKDDVCLGVEEQLLKVFDQCIALKTRILLGDRSGDLSDVFFDGLHSAGFLYSDLAVHQSLRAEEVRSRLRDVLEDGVVALAEPDDKLSRYVIESVGREVGNATVLHRGPEHFWALGTSNRRGFDVTWSPVLIANRWRPSIALQIFNIDLYSIQYAPGDQEILGPKPGETAKAIQNKPTFGFNVGLHPRLAYAVPLGPVLQLELGAGYVGTVRLTSDSSNSFVSLRHGPVLSTTLLGFERFYVDFSFVTYIDSANVVADAYQRSDIIPVISRRAHDLLLGVGWRFY